MILFLVMAPQHPTMVMKNAMAAPDTYKSTRSTSGRFHHLSLHKCVVKSTCYFRVLISDGIPF